MLKHHLKMLFIVFAITTLVPFYSLANAELNAENKNVLLICSYSENFVNLSGQLQGISEILSENDILLTVEYMSTKNFPGEENIANFKDRIAYKLNHHEPFDLVITADDSALDFVLANDDLFGNLPVVFFGVNDKEKALSLGENKRFSGLIESVSISDTIKSAKGLQPQATEVIALTDDSLSGKVILNEYYEVAKKFPEMTFTDLNISPLTLNEITSTINAHDKKAIILILTISKNGISSYEQFNKLGQNITSNSNLPIFTLHDFGLDAGFIGGKVFSFYSQAKDAAKMATQILVTHKPIKDNIVYENRNQFMFCHDTLKRYHLNKHNLPHNAIIVNNNPTFFEMYYGYIWAAIIALLLQFALIIALLSNVHNRKIVQQKLIEQNDKINHLAYVDSLTGYKSRLAIQEDITKFIQIKTGQYIIAFVDIDNFKYINDTFGHDFGDKLIKRTANRLVKISDNFTEFGRYGGDEFLLIKKIHPNENIQEFLNTIIEEFRMPFNIDENIIYISVSTGASLFPKHETEMNGLLKKADIALSDAKSHGRNRAILFKDSMIKHTENKVSFQANIRKAFLNNEFRLVYQPLYKVVTSEFYSVEALIRWHSPTLGHVSPQALIEEAEHMGLINDIGMWILKTAFEFCNTINAKLDHDIRIAINISSVQLKHASFIDDLKKLIQLTDVDTRYIYFEITESVMLDFTIDNIEILNQIKSLGIKVAIDDFGTGYSSLNYFKQLPADFLKIDKTFIDLIEIDAIDQHIVKFIIDLAHKKGLLVTAEGVENKTQLNLLKKLNCDMIQGYYFSKPLETKDLFDFLTNH